MKKVVTITTEKAITLIALVITIIVLLILAGVTINLTLGDNGIFKVAEQAVRNYKAAEEKELGLLEQFETELGTNFEYDATKGVNKPKILTGMTPIKFTEPTDTEEAQTVSTNETDESWYNYPNKQWANAQTEDGSMWVWIPRYAYKIDYTDATDKSKGGTIDVVFLIGSTDNYYDVDGNIRTAQRATSADEIVDTTERYTVHPAFTDESSISYANGGWDEELTGIWVAKFEAGYAGTAGNPESAKDSTVEYTQKARWANVVETGTISDIMPAANYYGEYVKYNSETYSYEWIDGVSRLIKYPVFQGLKGSMNYISINDMYNISSALTEDGNIYGLSRSSTDSHLMKNSEWGAVAYLCQSKYGLNETDIHINNANLNSEENAETIYAVTGCCGLTADAEQVETTLAEINARTETDIYIWCQKDGTAASTTGTVYGVYDMSGGLWEYTTGYVANENNVLKDSGASITYNGDRLKTVSTKYTTVYPHNDGVDYTETLTNIDDISKANYALNTKIYGDAVRETSTNGLDKYSWGNDLSCFYGLQYAYSKRGGFVWDAYGAGINAFGRDTGMNAFGAGFRAVLVAK